VLRADDDEIRVGEGSAILDMSLLEAPAGRPVVVEPGALVSHMACLHGAVVKTGALVGIGAIVLEGAVVGEGSLVGAGALVPPGMEVPSGVLVLGQPAKVIRRLKPAERETVDRQLAGLKAKAEIYRRG
jgi:carbonic anhydrase/acetyltransferase-like protein (isoleucine patch superfamily)